MLSLPEKSGSDNCRIQENHFGPEAPDGTAARRTGAAYTLEMRTRVGAAGLLLAAASSWDSAIRSSFDS